MTQEEIIEGNKLIAEFMKKEYQIPTDGYDGLLDYRNNPIDYSDDWGLLIPVVIKIESIEGRKYGVEIELDMCTISEGEKEIIYECSALVDSEYMKLEAVFMAVVNFIKWYNKKDG